MLVTFTIILNKDIKLQQFNFFLRFFKNIKQKSNFILISYKLFYIFIKTKAEYCDYSERLARRAGGDAIHRHCDVTAEARFGAEQGGGFSREHRALVTIAVGLRQRPGSRRRRPHQKHRRQAGLSSVSIYFLIYKIK